MRPAALFLLISWAVAAQVRPSLMADAGERNLPAQKLGVDDLVAVSVYDAPELTRTVRVESDGTIHLPLVEQGIRAGGLFPRELETAVVRALKSAQILVNPVVKVTVVEYHSRPVSVMGAVKRPLTFQAVGHITLLDALARAEGLAPDAGSEILVSRPQAGAVDSVLVERIPLKRLIEQADPAVNRVLTGGEEIRVPEAGKIFVVGNVRRPGAFPVRDQSETSVLRMIALAEGLMPYAAKLAYVYRRDPRSGDRKEIPVEIENIMARKSPDFPLEAEDVLYIPDNKTKRATINVIDRITSFGTNTASGVLIWRR